MAALGTFSKDCSTLFFMTMVLQNIHPLPDTNLMPVLLM